jgi:hypothetical protein
MRASAFFQEPHFSQLRREVEEQYAARSRTTLGGAILTSYQWGILAASLSSFMRDRRVPDLDPQNMWLHWEDSYGYVDAVAFEQGRFAALDDDPAAGHPDATLFPDVDALRDHLRTQLETYLGQAIQTLCQQIGANPRSMWPFVADRCTLMILWLGQLGQEKDACACDLEREVELLVKQPASPLYNPATGVLPVHYNGNRHLFVQRGACCYAYRREGHDYCRTCPHLPKEERMDRLQAALAQKYGENDSLT